MMAAYKTQGDFTPTLHLLHTSILQINHTGMALSSIQRVRYHTQ